MAIDRRSGMPMWRERGIASGTAHATYGVNRAPTLFASPGRAFASWITMGTRPRAPRYAGSAT